MAVAEHAAAVRALLERGGTVVFDYNGLGGGVTAKFLADLGLKHPGDPQGEYYAAIAAPGAEHPILATPHKVSGFVGQAYGWWTDWGDRLT